MWVSPFVINTCVMVKMPHIKTMHEWILLASLDKDKHSLQHWFQYHLECKYMFNDFVDIILSE
jgi:hypothetical protein